MLARRQPQNTLEVRVKSLAARFIKKALGAEAVNKEGTPPNYKAGYKVITKNEQTFHMYIYKSIYYSTDYVGISN